MSYIDDEELKIDISEEEDTEDELIDPIEEELGEIADEDDDLLDDEFIGLSDTEL
jgi:hypothetical protein